MLQPDAAHVSDQDNIMLSCLKDQDLFNCPFFASICTA